MPLQWMQMMARPGRMAIDRRSVFDVPIPGRVCDPRIYGDYGGQSFVTF